MSRRSNRSKIRSTIQGLARSAKSKGQSETSRGRFIQKPGELNGAGAPTNRAARRQAAKSAKSSARRTSLEATDA